MQVQESSFFVLRDRQDLGRLDSFIKRLFWPSSTKHSAVNRVEVFKHLAEQANVSSLMEEHPCSLVAVCLQTAVSGSLAPHSTISLPLCSDLLALESNPKFSGPLEPLAPRGLTVVEGKEGEIHIGVSQITRREMKMTKKARNKKLKQLIKHRTEGMHL